MRLGNRSSIKVYQANQERRVGMNGNIMVVNIDSDKKHPLNSAIKSENPFDVNLLDTKGMILVLLKIYEYRGHSIVAII
jgi:hypothetical protein